MFRWKSFGFFEGKFFESEKLMDLWIRTFFSNKMFVMELLFSFSGMIVVRGVGIIEIRELTEVGLFSAAHLQHRHVNSNIIGSMKPLS